MRRGLAILVLLAITTRARAAPVAFDEAEDEISDDPSVTMPNETIRVAGPPIVEVLDAAYAAAGLDRDLGGGWVRRARLAGLIPWVSVRTGRDTTWKEADPTIGHGTTVEVRATWRLDRLVFDGRELQVASLESSRRRERQRLANRVIRAYFQWRRTASASLSEPKWASHAEEAAAALDFLTDGWFSQAVTRIHSTTSEIRTR